MQSYVLGMKRSSTISGGNFTEDSDVTSTSKRLNLDNNLSIPLNTLDAKESNATINDANNFELEGIDDLLNEFEPEEKKEQKVSKARQLLDVMLANKITCYDDWCLEQNLDAYIEYSSYRNFNHDCAKFYKVVSVKQLKFNFQDFYKPKEPIKDTPKIHKIMKMQYPKWNNKASTWFCNLLKMHFNKELGKRNTLCFRGVANAGKSQLMATYVQWMVGNHYGKPSNNKNSSFPFDNCVNKRLILWEEPLVVPENIEDVKLLMGGEELRADIKFDSMMNVGRTPLIITTNNKLSKYMNEAQDALSKRMFEFWFSKALDSTLFPIHGNDWQEFFDKYYIEEMTLTDIYKFLKSKPMSNN